MFWICSILCISNFISCVLFGYNKNCTSPQIAMHIVIISFYERFNLWYYFFANDKGNICASSETYDYFLTFLIKWVKRILNVRVGYDVIVCFVLRKWKKTHTRKVTKWDECKKIESIVLVLVGITREELSREYVLCSKIYFYSHHGRLHKTQHVSFKTECDVIPYRFTLQIQENTRYLTIDPFRLSTPTKQRRWCKFERCKPFNLL